MNAPLPISSSGGRGSTPADDPHPKSGAGASPKPTLIPRNLLRTVANFVTSLPIIVRAWPLRSPKTSAALREKVMLGVTSINDCRYCEWGHTHWARANGVPLEEVNQILGLQIESLEARNPAEAAAILFAQHYAEHRDQFDPESIENLRKHYSDAQVDEILAYVRAITLGNLTGNTVDAFLDRFRSDGQPISFFQGVVGVALAPLRLTLILRAKIERKLGIAEIRSRWHQPRRDAPPNPARRLIRGQIRVIQAAEPIFWETAITAGPVMREVTSLRMETIHGYRETPGAAPPALLQETAGLGPCHGRAGRRALGVLDAHTAGAVGCRFNHSNLAIHGSGLAMDPPARPDHGGDPRSLRLPLLGSRGGGSGHVGDGAAETKADRIPRQ